MRSESVRFLARVELMAYWHGRENSTNNTDMYSSIIVAIRPLLRKLGSLALIFVYRPAN